MPPNGLGCTQDQFIETGGRFFVCPICFGERDLDASRPPSSGAQPRPWSSRAEGR
jgi:hypothetical protein